jgi:hypothetical protein
MQRLLNAVAVASSTMAKEGITIKEGRGKERLQATLPSREVIEHSVHKKSIRPQLPPVQFFNTTDALLSRPTRPTKAPKPFAEHPSVSSAIRKLKGVERDTKSRNEARKRATVNPFQESDIDDLEKEPFIIKAGLTRKDNREFLSKLFDVVSGIAKPYKHEDYGDDKVFGLSNFFDRMFPGRGLRVKIPERTQKKLRKLMGVDKAILVVNETGDDDDVEIVVAMKPLTNEQIQAASARRAPATDAYADF